MKGRPSEEAFIASSHLFFLRTLLTGTVQVTNSFFVVRSMFENIPGMVEDDEIILTRSRPRTPSDNLDVKII